MIKDTCGACAHWLNSERSIPAGPAALCWATFGDRVVGVWCDDCSTWIGNEPPGTEILCPICHRQRVAMPATWMHRHAERCYYFVPREPSMSVSGDERDRLLGAALIVMLESFGGVDIDLAQRKIEKQLGKTVQRDDVWAALDILCARCICRKVEEPTHLPVWFCSSGAASRSAASEPACTGTASAAESGASR